MHILKHDQGWQRAISDACRVTSWGDFNAGDTLYLLYGTTKVHAAGHVTTWGDYWDDQEALPANWPKCIPYLSFNGYYYSIELKYARTRPPELTPPPDCTKSACKEGRCAGKDWCRCRCDHWWE